MRALRHAAIFSQILGRGSPMIVCTAAYPSSWSVFWRHKDTLLILLLCVFCISALGRDLFVDGQPLDRRIIAAVSVPLFALWSVVIVAWILRTLRRHKHRILPVAILVAVILGAIWAHHHRGPAATVFVLAPGMVSVLIASVFVHILLMKNIRQHNFPLPPEEHG